MKKSYIGLILTLTVGLCILAHAGPDHQMKPYTGSKEFEQVKSLAGHWEGSMPDMHDPKKTSVITLDYHVTSGGSAVVETLGQGTPHEMITVYTDINGKVNATHYCMLANQPQMMLQKSTPTQIFLEVAENDKRIDPKSQHMRSLALDLSKPNQITQTWVSYKDGKPEPAAVFTFARKAQSKNSSEVSPH